LNTIYFDAKVNDEVRRKHLYQGNYETASDLSTAGRSVYYSHSLSKDSLGFKIYRGGLILQQ
jgi:hypothetical protein